MDLQVSELILSHHRIAYLKTDALLQIREAGGSLEFLRKMGIRQPMLRLVDPHSPSRGTYYVLEAAERFGTFSLEEIIPEIAGQSSLFLNVLHGVESRLELINLSQVSESGDGPVMINLTTVPEMDRAGRIIGLIHLLEDVSDLQLLKEECRHLRQSIEMLQNQLDMVAHELGTPLTLISGYLEILADINAEFMSQESKQCLELIEGSVDNLHIVVKSLFDIVFAEADGLRLALQPIDIIPLIQGAASEFTTQLESKSQQLVLKTSGTHARALCDNTRIMQVINNLLSNASKFSPVGSTIEIEVTLDKDDELIQVAIMDNGIGIASEERNAIFERFYRTQFGKRAESQGAGLGLYLCRMIIHLHGGQIWCQNSSEAGSTFCFTLPSTDLPLIDSGDHDPTLNQNGNQTKTPSTTTG